MLELFRLLLDVTLACIHLWIIVIFWEINTIEGGYALGRLALGRSYIEFLHSLFVLRLISMSYSIDSLHWWQIAYKIVWELCLCCWDHFAQPLSLELCVLGRLLISKPRFVGWLPVQQWFDIIQREQPVFLAWTEWYQRSRIIIQIYLLRLLWLVFLCCSLINYRLRGEEYHLPSLVNIFLSMRDHIDNWWLNLQSVNLRILNDLVCYLNHWLRWVKVWACLIRAKCFRHHHVTSNK